MKEVTIRIPATTANLGPGYDCLGVALQIYNFVTVSRGDVGSTDPMAMAAAEKFFGASDGERFPFSWTIRGEVPRSRGLGSSVTVRLGLLLGLNALAGDPLSRERLFALCAELEGHPDNAAPATFGGFTVAGGEEVLRFPVAPSLRFILLVPDFEVSTPAARAVLPATLGHGAAAESSSNACRITAAMASQKYHLLRGSFGDQLHQPFREKELIPFLSRVISAAEDAGAIGGFLSGSGSTICAVFDEASVGGDGEKISEAIGLAMLAASGENEARLIFTRADDWGAKFCE